ncbi:MAG: MBOAT family protein [Verrucomicrobiota bacterium]|nr:MBOAT family protein [Verrucomicrobiota bacterium]
MLFVEFRFFWFFLAVFTVYWSLRDNRARKIWLLVCSYAFYAAWNWKFLFLLIGSTTLDYIVGTMLMRTESPQGRRGWLILSLCLNLGTLAFFKYFNFFVSSGAGLLGWLGLPASASTLNIIIPVGVSFYTFHSMSYTIDVYHRRMRAVSSILDLATFIGFFPQMVAGPIVRARLFLPQLATARRFAAVDVRGALVLFLVGFVKKTCIADAVAPYSDRFFAAPQNFTAASAWVGVLFYVVQVYCDFSGYTDMALACARLLGYELPLNFNFPYLARNISDFWQRWHISLSSWLRDYLYIPLGGNRGTRVFIYRNLMLTMVLGGLWHGGAWTFVIWGALHGFALVVHREWTRRTADSARAAAVMRWLGWPLTLLWFCLALILFRSLDLPRAAVALKSFAMFQSGGTHSLGPARLLVVLLLLIIHWLNSRGVFAQWWRRLSAPTFAAGYGCTAAVVLVFVPAKYAPFIYFQF